MNGYFSAVNFRRACAIATVVMLASIAVVPAHAQVSSTTAAPMPGRVDFNFPGAPPATVEVDVSQGMLSALAGIGQAALGGATQALSESPAGQNDTAVQQSVEHLKAVNQVLNSVKGVIHEVRVRVYEGLTQEAQATRGSMIAHYQGQLRDSDWDSVVRVREGDSDITVSVLRKEDAIHGIFVLVAEDEDVVIANVVCELTPDKVQQVANQATKIGLQVGLEQAIQDAMRQMHRPHR